MTKFNYNATQILSKTCFSEQAFLNMKQIFAGFHHKLGISAFEYARVYDDGSAIMLYSNPDIAKYVINKELHITAHAPKEIIDNEFWFMPVANGPYSDVLQEIKNISNSNSFANYIQRHSGFYEMYSFWRVEEPSVAQNKFINMKEAFEIFCLEFAQQYKNMIFEADKDRFILTNSMQPNFRGIDYEKKTTNIMLTFYLYKFQQELVKLNAHIIPKLSIQELKCISFLVEGKTAVDIAELINLSPRTIEMHLNSIRIKLNCRKKSDIISTLINLAKNIQK